MGKRDQGLSLVEILMALALSMIILSIVTSVWCSIKETYRITESLARLQETARLISHIFNSNIRMAGYVGCGALGSSLSIINHTGNNTLMISTQTAIEGYAGHNNNWTPTLPNTLKREVVPDTDVITLRYLNPAPLTILRENMLSHHELVVGSTPNFKAGDKAIIADCAQVELFNVKSVRHLSNPNRQVLMTTTPLNKAFNAGSIVGMATRNIYFIGNTERVDAVGLPIHALYVEDSNGKKREIVTGVEKMKILYGITANDSTIISYYDAAVVSHNRQWSQVRSVKIALLLKSAERITLQPIQYIFQGQHETDPNGYLYKEWDLIVGLRNR